MATMAMASLHLKTPTPRSSFPKIQRSLFTSSVNFPLPVRKSSKIRSGIKISCGLIDPDGGKLVELFVEESQKDFKKGQALSLPSIRLSKIDLQWVHVLSEGWASPLKGFMRESEFLQTLHFNSLRLGDGSVVNMSVPIVLAIDDSQKQRIGAASSVSLLDDRNNPIAILKGSRQLMMQAYDLHEGSSDEDALQDPPPLQSQCDGANAGETLQIGKKRRLTSAVWDHFRRLPEIPNQPPLCECNKCGKKYKAGSEHGTGNLIRHLKRCVKVTTKDMGQYLISADREGSMSTRNPKFSQDKLRELIVHALIRHDLPFSFVEYEGFWNILKYLEPNVVQFCRNTARSDIMKLYAKERDRLRFELHSCRSRIALTSDAWTSIVTDGYLSLTAHYVDNNWNLQKRILNFSFMSPPHTGQALSEKIFGLVASWGIEKKLYSITLDNASSNDACVGILKKQLLLNNALLCKGELFHVRCSAHILNLVVQDGLKEIDSSVDKIRECVKYVKGSASRKDKFAKSVSQISLDSKKALVQDVPTRWNSTFNMLSSAIYYRRAFEHLQLADTKFTSCPTPDEWDKVKKICKFLELFYEATKAFSGSLYPTANLYFPNVVNIQSRLMEESQSLDPYMKKIAENMIGKFDKYWYEFNTLLTVAVVFDPRYKFDFIEFSYKRLYGPNSPQLSNVKSILFALFDEYMQVSLSNVGSSSSASNSESQKANDVAATASSLLLEFDSFEAEEYASGGKKSQLEMYLDEPRSKRTSSYNVLDFWRTQQYRYPDLAKLARDVLCVPVTTVASESAFSLGGRILDQYRSSMLPDTVEALICSRNWLFGGQDSSEMRLEELTRDIMELNVNKDESVLMLEDASSNMN